MLASGAGFIARGYTKRLDLLKQLIRDGISHRGFAFIDILQICATFFPVADYYTPRVYEPEGLDPSDFDSACRVIREWDYNQDARIALGTLYRRNVPTFDGRVRMPAVDASGRERACEEVFKSRI
jgi:2-oxoglutarate ferredoxin oxidoreductase subunit beta